MKIFIIGGIILLLILLCSVEHYTSRIQRYAKGIQGSNFLGNPLDACLMGSPIPDGPVKGSSGPGLTTNYDQYSMYSTKVWPDVYQPTTDTCFDEFMRECTYLCRTEDCLSSCQVRGTAICSQKKNIPALIGD